MKKYFLYVFFSLLCIVSPAQSKGKYERNPWVKYKVGETGGFYYIFYTFKDINSELRDVQIKLDQRKTDSAIARYGVPPKYFEPYIVTEETRMRDKKIKEEGMFMVDNYWLRPDYRALILYYRPFLRPVADLIRKILAKRNEDNERNRIELTMRFVQDIPYAVAPEVRRGKEILGLFPPLEVLILGRGDCDSKVVLFISILSYLIDPEKIIILKIPGHLMSGIRGESGLKEVSIMYEGKEYLVAETAGVAHCRLGDPAGKSLSSVRVIPLHIHKEDLH